MSKDIICSNCGEFIGNIGNLDICPICGQSLIGRTTEDENNEDE